MQEARTGRRHRRRRRARPPARPQRTAPTRSASSAPWSAPPSTRGDHGSTSTARSSHRGTAPRAAPLADLRRIFGAAARHVLPSTSRELLGAGPDGLAARRRPAERPAPRAARMTRARVGAAPWLLLLPLLAGCGRGQSYCDAVEGPPVGARHDRRAAATARPLIQALRSSRTSQARRPPTSPTTGSCWSTRVDRPADRARRRRRRPRVVRPPPPAGRPERRGPRPDPECGGTARGLRHPAGAGERPAGGARRVPHPAGALRPDTGSATDRSALPLRAVAD